VTLIVSFVLKTILYSFSSNIWYFKIFGCPFHCSLDNWRIQIVEDIIMPFLGTHMFCDHISCLKWMVCCSTWSTKTKKQ